MGAFILRALGLLAIGLIGKKIVNNLLLDPEKMPEIRAKSSGEKLQSMVSCAHCGLHIPIGDAITRHQLQFCCVEHADLQS